MANIMDKEAIIVDQSSIASDNSDTDIVQSSINFTNLLFRQYYRIDEVSQNAMRSYDVDYYLAQMLNGGFAQFVRTPNGLPLL
jgi:hypothetical protein